MKKDPLSPIDILDYEIRASWWANLVGWEWLQDLAGRYFAWKVNRKYARYQQWNEKQQRLEREYGVPREVK